MNYMGFDAFSYPPVLSVYCVKIASPVILMHKHIILPNYELLCSW